MVRLVYLDGTLNALHQPEEEGKTYRHNRYPRVEPVIAFLAVFQGFQQRLGRWRGFLDCFP